jgi:hypothetical protein
MDAEKVITCLQNQNPAAIIPLLGRPSFCAADGFWRDTEMGDRTFLVFAKGFSA